MVQKWHKESPEQVNGDYKILKCMHNVIQVEQILRCMLQKEMHMYTTCKGESVRSLLLSFQGVTMA